MGTVYGWQLVLKVTSEESIRLCVVSVESIGCGACSWFDHSGVHRLRDADVWQYCCWWTRQGEASWLSSASRLASHAVRGRIGKQRNIGDNDMSDNTDAVLDETFDEFLCGIRDATGLSRADADAQWSAHSRQMSDGARAAVERGGYKEGLEVGAEIMI